MKKVVHSSVVRWCGFAVILVMCSPLFAQAETMPPDHWLPNSPGQLADLQSSGAIQSEQGAEVLVRPAQQDGKPVGAMTSFDAAAMTGHQVTLTADLSVTGGDGQGEIWIRADLPGGKREFTNSWPSGDSTSKGVLPRQLEVKVDVPSATTRLVVGVGFKGQGAGRFVHMRVSVGRQVPRSPSAGEVLDGAMKIIKANALHSERIDWNQALPSAREETSQAVIPVDVYPTIRHVLGLLGDRHSSLSSPYQAMSLAVAGQSPDDVQVRNLSDGIAYLNMPSYRGKDRKAAAAFADAVRARLIASKGSRGWIIDLRDNSGGNVWPMLSALQPLLGDQQIGSFVAHEKQTPWFANGDREGSSGRHGPMIEVPVAVLIGGKTASSGEIVAVAFHGRPVTKFFGSHTAGLSTSNAEFQLADGSVLHLTTSIDADRNGVLFEQGVTPDEVVAGSSGDEAVIAATNWLSERNR